MKSGQSLQVIDFYIWHGRCEPYCREHKSYIILKEVLVKTLKTLLAISAVSLFPVLGQAAPINGGFGFGGNFTPLGGSTASQATGIDFMSPTGRIGTCDGTYTSIFAVCNSTTGDLVTVSDIAVGTFPVAGPVALAINNWITSGGFTFDLTSITNVSRDATGLTALTIDGTGIAEFGGYDNTPGTFKFTFNGVDAGTFTFSASVRSSAVPEPATAALLGLGLLGLGAVTRRRRS